MEKTITIETTAKASLLLALASMGITAKSTTDNANGTSDIVVDITDDQVNALNAAFSGSQATVGMIIRDGVDKIAEVVTDAADFAVNDFAIPVATIGVKAAASVGRIGVKAVAQTGASVINNLVDEGVKAVNGVKSNDECQKLKQSWATVKGLFAKKQAFSIK